MAIKTSRSFSLTKCLALGGNLQRRLLSTQVLPDLPYDYNALEPVISAEIMRLHHSKHHNTYVTGLNTAAEKYAEAEAKGDVQAMIALQPALRFNGGGHTNHSLFWLNLVPPKEFKEPAGELLKGIERKFGSFDQFKGKFTSEAVALQGSGWGWLGYDKSTGDIKIEATPNQDPLSLKGMIPLLGVDVWEHAYYLQYKNVRPDYVKEIWKVINWETVADRYARQISKP